MDGIDWVDKFCVRMDRKSKLIVSNFANWSWIQISLSVYPSWFCRKFRNRSRQLEIAGASLHGPRDSSARVAGVPGSFQKNMLRASIIPGEGWGHVPFIQTNFLDYPTHRILSMKKMQKILGNEQKGTNLQFLQRFWFQRICEAWDDFVTDLCASPLGQCEENPQKADRDIARV